MSTTATIPPALLTPEIVFSLFEHWINQRPGLDPRNYYSDFRDRDGRRAYDAEVRSIGQDRTRALAALQAARSQPWDASAMVDATKHAFSGRLQFKMGTAKDKPALAIDYCTGQYWPTEYRIAAATVLEEYTETVRPKQLPGPGAKFFSISDIEAASYRAGSKWFSRENKRFFRSRILPEVYQGKDHVFFVSSEQSGDDRPRLFTARVFHCATADIGSISEFNQSTREQARRVAKHAAELDRTGQHFKPANQGDKCAICGSYRDYCTGQ